MEELKLGILCSLQLGHFGLGYRNQQITFSNTIFNSQTGKVQCHSKLPNFQNKITHHLSSSTKQTIFLFSVLDWN